MPTIVNSDNLDAVNTAFQTAAQDILGNSVPGVWRMFTTVEPQRGTAAELVVYDGCPRSREWVGMKQFHELVEYSKRDEIRNWEASMRIPVIRINQDPTGAVSSRLDAFRKMAESFYDHIMIDQLVSNLTGYDGVGLLSASHPRLADLAAQDNITTSALSFAELENARQWFGSVTDGKGKPLGLRMTHILVGPAQETKAKQLTDSNQLVGVSDTGEYVAPGGSGVDGVGQMRNYIGGDAAVVVTPELSGDEWFAMDLGQGRSKPMYMADFEPPTLTVKNQADDDSVFYNDEVHMSIVGRMTPFAMNFQTVYGSVSA